MRRGASGGQVSVLLIVFAAVILMLSMSTFNIGMVALNKTETANASDAASLAAASWVASAQNEVALGPAKAMWINYLVFHGLLVLPFQQPPKGLWDIAEMWMIFHTMQHWRAGVANELLRSGWVQAHQQAVLMALTQSGVDDPRKAMEGGFGAFVHEVEEQFRAIAKSEDKNPQWPGEATPLEYTWDRQPDDGEQPDSSERGKQTLKVQVMFDQPPPEFDTSFWGPIATFWFPLPQCGPKPAWKFKTFEKQIKFLGNVKPKWFVPWVEDTKSGCFPFPFVLFHPEAKPSRIANGEGKIEVIITRTTQDADLRLWQADYPEEVTSRSVAKYTEAPVGLWPRDRSTPSLVEVE